MSRRAMTRTLGGLLLATVLAPSAALADYPFILPSSTSLSGSDAIVTFDAAGSDHAFFFDHRPIQLGSIRAWKPDGSPATTANAVQGRFRSVFDLRLDQEGTWKVASEQTMVVGTFKLDGEERRVGGRGPGGPGAPGGPGGAGAGGRDEGRREGQRGEGQRGEGQRGGGERRGGDAQRDAAARPPEGGQGVPGGPGGPGEGGPRRQPPVAVQDIPAEATDVHLREIVSTTAAFVTVGAPSATVLKPTGRGLEIEPITHPDALAMGETARFRFLIDGRPAPGIAVTAVPGGDRYREASGAMALTTGPDGVVAIAWPAAGMYWLGAEAEDRNPSEKRAETRRMSCAVTLEVMTP